MAILVSVKIYDNDTGIVSEEIIDTYCGSRGVFGWEVESMFEKLGKTVAKKTDSSYEG